MYRAFIITAALIGLYSGDTSAGAADDAIQVVEKHFQAGTLAAGENALEAILKNDPGNDHARFALGALQFVRSVEGLSQVLYRHGFLHGVGRFAPLIMPGGELPVPNNPQAAELDYDQARRIVQSFVSGLEKAEATLAKIRSDSVKLPLHFGLIRLDFDGDGTAGEEETLWKIYTRLNRQAGVSEEVARGFIIGFDAADVHWLRGYCQLLMALGEITLAHDWHELFSRTGHLLFARAKSNYPFLTDHGSDPEQPYSFDSIADIIAFIHLMNFPVAEPKRMQNALGHLEAMVSLSRRSWDLIAKETDDDHEWIPSPKQTGVIPNVRVTQEMIEGWRGFLAEAEVILKGERLIPFWRGHRAQGVNLRRVFTQPQTFDLVMWIQGTGAAPYLEQGTLTSGETWDRLQRVFQGEFIGFAFWFN
jgi:hypothetical protein